MESNCRIVLTTFPKDRNPVTIAETIVKEKLAACVQVLPQMTSVYLWQGKINKDTEFLVLFKSIESKVPELMARIKELHPYDTPQIVAIRASDIDKSYQAWLTEALS